uniref:ubiquitinyl hydrolase 1 n=1 Tax=Araucaria cunninghamii TaxID=56994 RepID=A0A0D6QZU1_ARACU
MADHDDEELKMALQMSLQPPPEAKRSKPLENAGTSDSNEAPDARARRLQREQLADAAEKRMLFAQMNKAGNAAPSLVRVQQAVTAPASPAKERPPPAERPSQPLPQQVKRSVERESQSLSSGQAEELYHMVFGRTVTKDILSQWCKQGFRFSSESDTSMGLVQREGGPCGVLAAIQALVLKYLLFMTEEGGQPSFNALLHNIGSQHISQTSTVMPDNFSMLADHQKTRALVLAMAETLWLSGRKHRAVLASLNIQYPQREDHGHDGYDDEIMAKALEGISINSASELQKVLRINTFTSQNALVELLKEMLPVFQSRMGALLFLFSALLSRGLDAVQADRDDPAPPLVTAPFGHASQEIVNLLLCGHAVSNVFDDRMDLGDGLCLKGIPTNVEVGFLSLLESLNFCKVGQYLKHPRWPIWVVGSESHYTVLFALDTDVQKENELEDRQSQIRKAFDAHDQSGGGGFISSDALQQLLRDMNINMPRDKFESLCSTDYVVWNEFWQVLMQLDKSLGGLKDSSGLNGRKQFDLYHFNGIAKAVINNTQNAGEALQQRPRLTKLRVSVPPKWTPEEFMADVSSSHNVGPSGKDESSEPQGPSLSKDEPAQHAPLVDCIRTRWPRAVCNWVGDPPSIV